LFITRWYCEIQSNTKSRNSEGHPKKKTNPTTGPTDTTDSNSQTLEKSNIKNRICLKVIYFLLWGGVWGVHAACVHDAVIVILSVIYIVRMEE
jgi:hypothetical protein